ncbi:hypothetical protein PMAYCL1PPCAC_04063 [Pristionchus mayeri]|uniref:ShKT domain-containing protein n=1 Tax=Pristionchus mayeri TaxID=1317129 RepID=A0AAN4Z8D2_9BILA|nr:hypothetical protein PMAYCL1PPCAC_04063 [Pristionchus mayeri]
MSRLVAFLLATAPIVVAQGPCQADGAFMVNARSCEDMADIATCHTTFPITDNRPSERCFQTAYADFASLCRKTCFLCCQDPQYNCPDRPDAPFSCADMHRSCNTWKDVMTYFCPGTCGHCQHSQCKDNRLDCANFKGLCSDPDFAPLMRSDCSLSCGFCTSSGPTQPIQIPEKKPEDDINCFDSDSRCAMWARNGYCINPKYEKAKCRKSCGLCGSSSFYFLE